MSDNWGNVDALIHKVDMMEEHINNLREELADLKRGIAAFAGSNETENSKIRILILRPIGNPEWKSIENNFEAMNEVVGGESDRFDCGFEIFPTTIENVVIIAASNAKLKNKPRNFDTEKDIIAGDAFLVGLVGENFVDITDEQAKAFMSFYLPSTPLECPSKL